jgi:hypothetical protein
LGAADLLVGTGACQKRIACLFGWNDDGDTDDQDDR